jgi:cytochrome b pre-mRNA-processing protein 3
MTQKLFEACSSQADYQIPQISQKGVPVPKTETGEDRGVGESWWFKGEPTPSSWLL